MEVLCLKAAFADSAKFKIKPPSQIEALKQNAEKLHAAGAEVAKTEKPAEGAGLLSSAAGKAKAVAGVAAGMTLTAAAQALNGVTKDLEAPFQTVAKDVIDNNGAKLHNILVAFINGYAFVKPLELCRGTRNEKGELVPQPDAISKSLMSLAAEDLHKAVLPEVREAIKEHLVTTAWKKAVEMFNAAFDTIAGAVGKEKLESKGVKKVDFDVAQYGTQQILEQLGQLMAAEEAATRKAPKDKDIVEPLKPITFEKVFGEQGAEVVFLESDYTMWESGVQVVEVTRVETPVSTEPSPPSKGPPTAPPPPAPA